MNINGDPEAKQNLGTKRDASAPPQRGGGKAFRARISEGSFFYTRLLPILILVMGVLTAALVLFAAGVLLGVVPFR